MFVKYSEMFTKDYVAETFRIKICISGPQVMPKISGLLEENRTSSFYIIYNCKYIIAFIIIQVLKTCCNCLAASTLKTGSDQRA